MKKHTIFWSLICAIVFLTVLPITVNARKATFQTIVPSEHAFHLVLKGKGIVIIDDSHYSKSQDSFILRHSTPCVQVQAARGYSIRSVTYNQENITHLFNSGKWIMPTVESDITLSVVFARDSGNPPTGDTFNPWIIVWLILSQLGLLVCVLNVHRKN